MNIILHMPETKSGLRDLSQRVAEIHAMAIIHQLDNSTCSKSEKLSLIKAAKDSYGAKL